MSPRTQWAVRVGGIFGPTVFEGRRLPSEQGAKCPAAIRERLRELRAEAARRAGVR